MLRKVEVDQRNCFGVVMKFLEEACFIDFSACADFLKNVVKDK